MQELVQLEFFSRSFSMPCASFSMFDADIRHLVYRYRPTKEKITRGPSSIENDAHGIEKLLQKNSSKLNKFLHSKMNLLIQHIIVRINLLFYLSFPPSSHPTFVCFFPVGLSLLIQHFQQVLWVLKKF